MRHVLARAAGPPVLALLLILSLAGCGGFGHPQPAIPDTSLHSYVALGDGFAAGPYAGRTTPGGCLRGTDNYPALVARELRISSFKDVTCTGATTASLTHASHVGGTTGTVPAQIDAVTSDTDLVTVNTGIMDDDLVSTMFRVCVALPCGSDVAGQVLLGQLAAFADSATSLLRAISAKAPRAYVFVVGYPQLMPATAACAKLPAMTKTQLDAANIVLAQLNSDLQSSARQTGATFVDLAALSAHHNACSPDPWVAGKTGVAGHSIAFHPSAAEQSAVATAVVAAVRAW